MHKSDFSVAWWPQNGKRGKGGEGGEDALASKLYRFKVKISSEQQPIQFSQISHKKNLASENLFTSPNRMHNSKSKADLLENKIPLLCILALEDFAPHNPMHVAVANKSPRRMKVDSEEMLFDWRNCSWLDIISHETFSTIFTSYEYNGSTRMRNPRLSAALIFHRSRLVLPSKVREEISTQAKYAMNEPKRDILKLLHFDGRKLARIKVPRSHPAMISKRKIGRGAIWRLHDIGVAVAF